MTRTSPTSANSASNPDSVPGVSQTGMPCFRASLATPPIWSSCSCVTTIAERLSGERPRRPSLAAVADKLKPQSSRTRVSPASTTRALPSLPLPSEAKRIASRAGSASALFQLLLQQGQDAARRRGSRLVALGIQYLDLAALGGVGDAD